MSSTSTSLKMSLNPGPTILHSLAASIMAWGYTQLEHTVANEWIIKQKGGHFQFLTIQGYVNSRSVSFLHTVAQLRNILAWQ